jgi:hypothetical protein
VGNTTTGRKKKKIKEKLSQGKRKWKLKVKG